MKPQALSMRQVAEALQVHVVTARQYIREGRITHVHVGSRIRVGEEQLADFLAGKPSAQVCDVCRPFANPTKAAS